MASYKSKQRVLLQGNIALAVLSKHDSVCPVTCCAMLYFLIYFELVVPVGNHQRLDVNNMSPEKKKY